MIFIVQLPPTARTLTTRASTIARLFRLAAMASNNDDIREVVCTAAASLGYPQLKPEQEKAIIAFVRGEDVFVSLPNWLWKVDMFWLVAAIV